MPSSGVIGFLLPPGSVTQTSHLSVLSWKHLRLISHHQKNHSPCSSVFALCSVLPYLISSPPKQICFLAPCQSCSRRWSRPLIFAAKMVGVVDTDLKLVCCIICPQETPTLIRCECGSVRAFCSQRLFQTPTETAGARASLPNRWTGKFSSLVSTRRTVSNGDWNLIMLVCRSCMKQAVILSQTFHYSYTIFPDWMFGGARLVGLCFAVWLWDALDGIKLNLHWKNPDLCSYLRHCSKDNWMCSSWSESSEVQAIYVSVYCVRVFWDPADVVYCMWLYSSMHTAWTCAEIPLCWFDQILPQDVFRLNETALFFSRTGFLAHLRCRIRHYLLYYFQIRSKCWQLDYCFSTQTD